MTQRQNRGKSVLTQPQTKFAGRLRKTANNLKTDVGLTNIQNSNISKRYGVSYIAHFESQISIFWRLYKSEINERD